MNLEEFYEKSPASNLLKIVQKKRPYLKTFNTFLRGPPTYIGHRIAPRQNIKVPRTPSPLCLWGTKMTFVLLFECSTVLQLRI